MLATTIYTLVAQQRVLPKYRTALVMSSMVTFIAAYHYFRIFNSFHESSTGDAVKVGVGQGAFNEAYRYVDWILTVPLLLVEVVAVLGLAKAASSSLIQRLVPASALMIALGYPGEVSAENGTKTLWGVLSTIPFLYILYVLFVELSKSLDRQPEGVAATVGRLLSDHDANAAAPVILERVSPIAAPWLVRPRCCVAENCTCRSAFPRCLWPPWRPPTLPRLIAPSRRCWRGRDWSVKTGDTLSTDPVPTRSCAGRLCPPSRWQPHGGTTSWRCAARSAPFKALADGEIRLGFL